MTEGGRWLRPATGEAAPGASSAGGAGQALKRYGPILLVIVLIGVVIAIASGGDDDEGGDGTTTTTGDNSDLPMTYDEAVAAGDGRRHRLGRGL